MNRIALLGAVLAIGALIPSNAASRPLNPHLGNHAVVRHREVPVVEEVKPDGAGELLSASKSTRQACDKQGLISASGDALVQKLKAASSSCVNQLFSVTGNDATQAFNLADMLTVANSFYSAAWFYDAKNPAKDSTLQQVLFLRAGYYVQYYQTAAVGNYTEQLRSLVQQGVQYLFDKGDALNALNDVNYDTLAETITLITNADLTVKMIDATAALLTRITAWTSWTLLEYGQGNALNNIWNVYWRLTFATGSNEALANKVNVPQAADNFMTKRANLFGTGGEWLLKNAATELSRLLQFSTLKATVSPLVQKQIKKFSLDSGARIWVSFASSIETYDKANCAIYGTCNWKDATKAKIFTKTRVCPIQYVDQFTAVAQTITDAQLDQVCTRLKAHESYFHSKLNDNWAPVKDDYNSKLTLVIYASREDYQAFNNALNGIDTNNGGIYIEGNPADKNNIPYFYCYVQMTYDGKWDVWNLEHETTHYFDGRYDLYGDFQTAYKYPTVWWSEGLGEYIAHKNDYSSVTQVCTDLKYSLSSVFTTVYDDGQEKVYYYGYTAVRFMFERHRPNVDQIVTYFRAGKYDDFKTYMQNTIGNRYDSEFVTWCKCIAAGKPC